MIPMMTGLMAQGSGSATDPYFANVVSLLHFDVAGFVDVTGKTWTVNGGASISATLPKFGGGAGLFDGNNDWIECTDASFAPGTGDWCYEQWPYRLGNTAAGSLAGGTLMDMRTAEPSVAPALLVSGSASSPSQAIIAYVNGANRIISGSGEIGAVYRHIALVKDTNVLTLYLDGAVVGTWADTSNYTATRMCVGGRFGPVSGDYRSWNGYIDDHRYTVGVPRYTAPFSPPSSPFPDS